MTPNDWLLLLICTNLLTSFLLHRLNLRFRLLRQLTAIQAMHLTDAQQEKVSEEYLNTPIRDTNF